MRESVWRAERSGLYHDRGGDGYELCLPRQGGQLDDMMLFTKK